MSGDRLEPYLTSPADVLAYWRCQLNERDVDPALPWKDAEVVGAIRLLVEAFDALAAADAAEPAARRCRWCRDGHHDLRPDCTPEVCACPLCQPTAAAEPSALDENGMPSLFRWLRHDDTCPARLTGRDCNCGLLANPEYARLAREGSDD